MRGLIFAIAVVAVDSLHKQAAFLIDASVNGPLNTDLPAALSKAIKKLKASPFTQMEVSLGSFVDKPNVMTGVGQYGGYPGPYLEDYCYYTRSPFSTDMSKMTTALDKIPNGSGMDLWEGQFEAIIRMAVDPKLGWVDKDTDKMIVLITDSFGHSAALDTLAEKVGTFNAPVRCVDGKSVGGFGAQETTVSYTNWALPHGDNDFAQYKELADLYYNHSCVAALKGADFARLVALREMHSPTRVADVLPFNMSVLLSDPSAHCRYHEYPAYEDVAAVLKERNIKLAVVFVDNLAYTRASQYQVWEWALSADTGFKSVRTSLTKVNADNLGDFTKVLKEALDTISGR